MAEIAPFRGLRYSPKAAPDLAKVVIPPYDVISPAEQELFLRTSPYNMVHLELGRSDPSDTPDNNSHTRAGRTFEDWVRNGVLVRETLPAVYYYELDYALSPGREATRRGFICAMRLEDFRSGTVRPHEKTFQAVKDERLGLMLSCGANLSSVFSLYSDPESVVDETLRSGREAAPAMAFVDRQGMSHRIWRVTDRGVLERVAELMKGKAIFIADGHHRYETGLNYRDIQRRRHPSAGPDAAFEYIMMYLSNLNQEGLTILPTHRLLRNLGSWDPESILKRAEAFFEVKRFSSDAPGERMLCSELASRGGRKETAIGFFWDNVGSFFLLSARREPVSSYLAGRGIPAETRGLDVVVLDQVVLRNLLGLSEEYLSSEHNIHFKHDLAESIGAVRSGDYEAAFLINPTRIEQVQEVASAKLVMPHKSTYFYPKVGSGMVIRSLSPEEETVW